MTADPDGRGSEARHDPHGKDSPDVPWGFSDREHRKHYSQSLVRRIERAWKGWWFPAVDAMLTRRSNPDPSRLATGPRRVLYLRYDRIGDAIVSYPLLEALHNLSPDITIDVLCSPRNFELVRRFPFVDRIHLYEKGRFHRLIRLGLRLRRSRYDAVIYPMVSGGRSMTSLLIMWASGAPNRVGFADYGLDAITHSIAGDTRSEPIGELLARFIVPFGGGTGMVAKRPSVPLTERERSWGNDTWRAAGAGRRVLVNISGGHQTRDWPDDRFVSVIRSILERPDTVVLVVGAPFARERVWRIAMEAGAVAVATPELGMLMGLTATADFLFTPDTSVVHMAAAFEVPAVAMYLKGTARQWGHPEPMAVNIECGTSKLADLALDAVLPVVMASLDSVVEREAVT